MKYRAIFLTLFIIVCFQTAYSKPWWWSLDSIASLGKFPKFCIDTYRWGDHTFNSYDSIYVVGTGKRWNVKLKTDNWTDHYNLSIPDMKNITMTSNLYSNIGVTLTYMAVSASYAFDVSRLFEGHSQERHKWDFNFCCGLIAIDAFYSSNEGSTNITRFPNYNGYKRINYRFDGIDAKTYGLDLYYFFNNKKYAQAAAYNYSKIQRKSSGSFIGGVTISHQNIKFDFNGLPAEMQSQLPDTSRVYHFNYMSYCAIIGYGYNWVFKPRWLLNVTLMPCLGFRHSKLNDIESDTYDFTATGKAKIGLIHNHNRIFVSFVGNFDTSWYISRRYSFFNSVFDMNLSLGYRF